ncbi:SH3 domain-containing kinase-binding protein 1-like isoform X2 [Myxocyprinus asiaticus]|uniref:SH3 domain-containing kinase-binding protein 1-like isoform X2 n=1 Tax=Myxocyprinus asiaticus TaxID=70543 RepID=UPI00222268CC|nr:SH3 domain-containing kinase-binding protein 1-like isoform X2 [Myxocyprinus asiaticus]
MEVLVLLDFEATMEDELTVRAGDVVKNISKAKEDGWLEGELKGKRGIFPANFAKEVPVYLIGDSNREPRSIRKSKKAKVQQRRCEVTYAYTAVHEDELELVVGETIEILREIEDGWWMGKKNNHIGAFPSNFVKEIVVPSQDSKTAESKTRPKLSEAVSNNEEKVLRAILRRKSNVKECCRAMFDYTAVTEDELSLKKGDVITIMNKVTEDEGWWEGELNGRRGFFPDNFVMVIPADALHTGNAGGPPVRRGTEKHAGEKPATKHLRSEPPGKIKLPGLHKPPVPPPPVKEKPIKIVPRIEEPPPISPKQPPVSPILKEDKEKAPDQFDGVDVSSEKLSHPTANRAKPPQRRPPTALATASNDPVETDHNGKSEEKDGLPQNIPALPKVTENPSAPPNKMDQPPKTQCETKPVIQEDSASLASVLKVLKDLRMSLDLLKNQHERDIQELKDELKDERGKRMRLQDEVEALRKK